MANNWMKFTNKAVGIVLLIFGFIFSGQAWAKGEIAKGALPFLMIIIGLWLLWPRENAKV